MKLPNRLTITISIFLSKNVNLKARKFKLNFYFAPIFSLATKKKARVAFRGEESTYRRINNLINRRNKNVLNVSLILIKLKDRRQLIAFPRSRASR